MSRPGNVKANLEDFVKVLLPYLKTQNFKEYSAWNQSKLSCRQYCILIDCKDLVEDFLKEVRYSLASLVEWKKALKTSLK